MTEETSDSIWPDVELTDSDDEEEEKASKSTKKRHLGVDPTKSDTVTEEEINGDFPPIIVTNADDESSDEEDKEGVKVNPYLSLDLDEAKEKYTGKLRDLHLRRNEARKLNHQEVAAEDQRLKLPANYEARRLRAEWQVEDTKARQAALERGEDYERTKILEETAEDIEIFERRKRKKKNIDPGFSDFATAQFRKYEGLAKQMKPDLEAYQHSKEKLGDAAFPGAHNLLYGCNDKVSERGMDKMVADLEKQMEKRGKFHRRRQHNDEADIDYINERNAKFNQKAERFYGQYTKEIKQNLERGTAVD